MAFAGVLLSIACVIALSAIPARAADITGRASIVSGDMIEVEDVTIRLHGIDAPEPGQRCGKAGGGSWPCGNRATEVLEAMAEDRDVECTTVVSEDDGHQSGVCAVGDLSLNEQMVAEGYAWAVRDNGDDYASFEAQARAESLGIWQGRSVAPWDYRDERWTAALQDAPDGCPIKGIVARGEHVYHTPWSPWYDRVKVNEAKGGRWFCTEREAIEAGWRVPRSR